MSSSGQASIFILSCYRTGSNEALLEAVFTAPHDQGNQDHLIVLTRSIHGDSVGGGHDAATSGFHG